MLCNSLYEKKSEQMELPAFKDEFVHGFVKHTDAIQRDARPQVVEIAK
jgi:hypothetical protein